ncbi:hypothetical protein HHL16_09080 [Pseudoflavitalea sp. G-6-1-2]|uniref:hypothetical protein n=1 Tax=Pseudoflavitalea sp. G-6-1-2 TaxID=2728841 RepID=UPI001469B901|nr:hypothetical protein [Pseudoflavitalea sp. G-6-1-2]NML21024.1 hypothetical protein [Pseudoflavitalea sp. G-6-1-2]
MKLTLLTLVSVLVCLFAIGQRKTTTVRSYFRKDGTFVRSHTRHYNAGDGSGSSYSYSSTGASSGGSTGAGIADNIEISETELKVAVTESGELSKKIGGLKVYPSRIKVDSNGATILIAVLRYNDSVVDVCPVPRNIVSYDYNGYSMDLKLKILKARLKPEHVDELTSKYQFEWIDDQLRRTIFLGYGKIELPKYLDLKIEALTLK